MRFLGKYAFLLLAALIVCTASVGYADSAPPSTSGWTLTPVIDGSVIQLLVGVDNVSDLSNWQGFVTRTWGDPTGANPDQFITLGDSGAVLQSLVVKLDGDPQVSYEFHITAGSSDINVTVGSTLVSFAPLNDCSGTATAALTVTDNNGDGALATGGYDGRFYRAACNSASNDTFCYLIGNPISALANRSSTASANVPPWQTMNGPIYDISSGFNFHLSANDSASGTSNFVVIPTPEPGSVMALFTGLVGLAGFASRRRRA